MREFKIRKSDINKALKQALAQTYSYSPHFENESDFKHELFHQLHGMEINGYKLGDKLPGTRTCMLHAEANPIAGTRRTSSKRKPKADLVICNPSIDKDYNYQVETVVELKKALNLKELRYEIEKFGRYSGIVPELHIASANQSRIDRTAIDEIVSERTLPGTNITVYDRSSIPYTAVPQSRRRSRAKTALSERVAKCIRDTLHIYGDDRDDKFHNFFWRNYEPETEKRWTFPCEGDFTAQLYHRLRVEFGQNAEIRAEYQPLSVAARKRVDLFIKMQHETVGIEVKMNYDNFKSSSKRDEVESLSQKFEAMSRANSNHTNMLVVIQGQHGFKGNSKPIALHKLRDAEIDFCMLYYAEHDNKAIGPVSIEETQG
ncbi:MAG: hypothetical protein OXG80_05960 [Chloroflexi bacterium]|nr:hypothetical protein [Chloroflexota bacterium]